jgi:DNA polymerase III delta' subunit
MWYKVCMLELSDIVGQEEAIALLEHQLSGGRPHHALLFAGPRGVGRRTTAMALAKTLLCEKPGAPGSADGPALFGTEETGRPDVIQACGACPECRMFDAGSHPDFQLVTKEHAAFHPDANVRSRTMQELGIDVIRHFLIAPAGRSANRGRGKVFVVLEAELMSTAAQNSLLKTLEEPPPGVTIILITSKPDRLLPTTLSRCCRVPFGYLPTEFVDEKLTAAGVGEEEAGFWARFTEGSIGRALGLSEAGMYERKCKMIAQSADPDADGFGDYLQKTMDALAETYVKDSKKDADSPTMAKTLASRRVAGDMLEILASFYRDAMATAVGADAPAIHADQPREIESVAGRFPASTLADIIEQLSHYERLIWRNVSPKTLWENVAITCLSGAPLRV